MQDFGLSLVSWHSVMSRAHIPGRGLCSGHIGSMTIPGKSTSVPVIKSQIGAGNLMGLASKPGFYHFREAEDTRCPLRAFLRSLIHRDVRQEQEQDQHCGFRSGFSFIPESRQDPVCEEPWLPCQEGFVRALLAGSWHLVWLKSPLF